MFMRTALLVTLLVGVSACSTYSKRQCSEMDWGTLGYQAALKGDTLDSAQNHYSKECGEKHSIQPDSVRLQAGFDEGLKKFCSGEEVFKFAQEGGVYRGHCTPEEETKFLPRYQAGRLDYLAKKVEDLESEISRLRSQNSELQSQVSSLEGRPKSCP